MSLFQGHFSISLLFQQTYLVNGKPVLSNVVGIAKKSYNSLQLAVLINILVF